MTKSPSMTERRRRPPKVATIRDRLSEALQILGYRPITRRHALMVGCEELVSPLADVGKPLMRARHSVFVDRNGGVRLLRAGASLEYAVPLPQPMMDLLLGRVGRRQ